MIKEKAYAKINLFLNVVGKRLDGYHELEMVMIPLKLHDKLKFERIEEKKIEIKTNKEITKNIEDNIVYKIATYLMEEYDVENGVKITIDKNIPQGGGLGGGSADGAATIRGLNRLWKLDLSLQDMAEMGETFGADVPFCVYNKPAVVRGIGEKLDFIKCNCYLNVLLVNPGYEISTKEVFSKVDINKTVERNISHIVEGIQMGEISVVEKELFNYLETITFEMKPEINNIKNTLIDSGLKGVLMSGSGATVFAISNSKKELKEIGKSLNKDYKVVLTKTTN